MVRPLGLRMSSLATTKPKEQSASASLVLIRTQGCPTASIRILQFKPIVHLISASKSSIEIEFLPFGHVQVIAQQDFDLGPKIDLFDHFRFGQGVTP